jgi:hypothetical protein
MQPQSESIVSYSFQGARNDPDFAVVCLRFRRLYSALEPEGTQLMREYCCDWMYANLATIGADPMTVDNLDMLR